MEEQQRQAAAAQAMALADEANKQRRHKAAAWTAESAALVEAALARMQYKLDCCSCAALAEEQQRQAAAALAKALAELVAHAAASAETLLANKQRCLEAAERATALAAKALADERQRRDATKCAAALAAKMLAHKKEAADRTQESAAATLAVQVFTKGKQCQEENERILVLDMPPDPIDMAIRRIQAKCALRAAPLDAILAEKLLAEEQRCHKTATRDKALADKANKQRRAAAQEKALADKANKQCQAAARDNALADEANKQRCHESAERATTLSTKALAEDEHNDDNNNVALQIEAHAAPLFACIDAVMAEI